MHIPNGTTAELTLVTFQQALEAANTPSEQYDTENIVSKDSSLYKIVFIILIIAILAIGVLFVFLRRDDYDKN